MMSSRKTITKVKAQLEFHTVAKGNKNVLTNKSVTKRRLRRVSILFWMQRETLS